MQFAIQFGVGLVALLVMLLPALAHKQHWNVIREEWRYPFRLVVGVLQSELGASILYTTPPYTPSATALTAAQAKQTPTQIAPMRTRRKSSHTTGDSLPRSRRGDCRRFPTTG